MRPRVWFPYLLLVLLGVGCLHDWRPPDDHDPVARIRVGELEKARVFAFGATGYAGEISEGEKLFFQVYNRRDAAEQLARLYRRGNSEAKMYALCGLFELDRKRFTQLTEKPGTLPRKVQVMSGCILFDRSGEEIVISIAAGRYSKYLRSGGRD